MGNLTAEHILALIEHRIPESQELEYKRELPGAKDSDKREFLADVSSFANTTGGVILYGVATGKDENGEDSGLPDQIMGVPDTISGNDLLRFSQVLHSGFSPRLSGEAWAFVSLPDGRRVVALGIPRSMFGPHMVWSEKSGRVIARKGAHKDQVDAVELRQMFLESNTWLDDAESFRAPRVELAAAQSASYRYLAPADTGRLLLHVLPLGRLNRRIDLRPHEAKLRNCGSDLLSPGGFATRYNFDGYLLTQRSASRKWSATVQWFRSGAVEWADSTYHGEGHGQVTVFSADRLTPFFPRALKGVITFMSEALEAEPPIAIGLSVVGLLGARLANPDSLDEPRSFDTDRIVIPMEIVEDSAHVDEAAKNILEVLWQSANVPYIPKLPLR